MTTLILITPQAYMEFEKSRLGKVFSQKSLPGE